MRRGSFPCWWKKPLKQVPATFNASGDRRQHAHVRDAFKAIAASCRLPAVTSGSKRPDSKQPYFMSAADGGVLSFAGLHNLARHRISRAFI
jgi:putative SOS response-associated peptidase YedK